MDLKDKVILVTGASRGIGAAIAKSFGEKGAKVIVNYVNNKSRADKVVSAIGNNDAIAIKADVSKKKEVKKLFQEAIKEFGKVDMLVNNASVTYPEEFKKSTEGHWKKQFDVTFFSAVWCTQEYLNVNKRKTGKIINISSIRGIENYGRPGITAYSAAKAAMINFTKTMAKELAPSIQVNTVAPGFTFTENYEKFSKELQDKFVNSTFLKKWIYPEDIAKTVIFLAEDEVMTGQVLTVDAGFSLKDA